MAKKTKAQKKAARKARTRARVEQQLAKSLEGYKGLVTTGFGFREFSVKPYKCSPPKFLSPREASTFEEFRRAAKVFENMPIKKPIVVEGVE